MNHVNILVWMNRQSSFHLFPHPFHFSSFPSSFLHSSSFTIMSKYMHTVRKKNLFFKSISQWIFLHYEFNNITRMVEAKLETWKTMECVKHHFVRWKESIENLFSSNTNFRIGVCGLRECGRRIGERHKFFPLVGFGKYLERVGSRE